MTTQTQKTISFNVSKATGWKDLFVVASLAIVLGAFVAQISSTPQRLAPLHPVRLRRRSPRPPGERLEKADGGRPYAGATEAAPARRGGRFVSSA